jgi:hypothetical protein
MACGTSGLCVRLNKLSEPEMKLKYQYLKALLFKLIIFIISHIESHVLVHAVQQGYNIFRICQITHGRCTILGHFVVGVYLCR